MKKLGELLNWTTSLSKPPTTYGFPKLSPSPSTLFSHHLCVWPGHGLAPLLYRDKTKAALPDDAFWSHVILPIYHFALF